MKAVLNMEASVNKDSQRNRSCCLVRNTFCKVSIPFLYAIDNVIFPIRRLGGRRLNIRNIGPSLRLCDGNTGPLLS